VDQYWVDLDKYNNSTYNHPEVDYVLNKLRENNES
jgi:hypothetical protein